jgi:superfamily I DNA/RNA helicase
MAEHDLRVSFDVACMRSLKKVPSRVFERFHDMILKVISDPSRQGLNVEPIQGASDSSIKSIRIDQGYRAIGYLQGRELLLLHVDEHDKAYRWATNKTVRFNPSLNRIQVLDMIVEASANEPKIEAKPSSTKTPLFRAFSDKDLIATGLDPAVVLRARRYHSESDLEADKDQLDPASFDILFSLAAGFSLQEIPELVGSLATNKAEQLSFAEALRTEESRQEIFVPDGEEELRRFLNGELEGWRVFLHPDQRRIAYHKGYAGPTLVRGGAGTGKTVVAMHRAKHLADDIAKDSSRRGEKVLFTTFTSTLAKDVEANLKALCPEHLAGKDPRLEVINLDRWVGEFLRRRGFDRKIVYFGDDRVRLDEIWADVLAQAEVPKGLSDTFIRDEWSQVIQAKGISTEKAYFAASRVGRGTPLDRLKRRALWAVFQAYSARKVDEDLAEPDDAYREAMAILERDGANLPYTSVVVDEAQDMGEPALRLVRAIVPKASRGDRNSLFIVGDAHQRIYDRKSTMAACGIDVRGRSKRLRLNYRTTELIRRWAVGALEGLAVDDMDEGIETLAGYRSLVKGTDPTLVGYKSSDAELTSLSAWLKEITVANDKPQSVAVLARTNDALDKIESRLAKDGLTLFRLKNDTLDDPARAGIRLATMHRAKGLEFDVVAIAGLSDVNFPPKQALKNAPDDASRRDVGERERSLLHVAATRPRSVLRVSWHGTKPTLLPV